MQNQIELNNDSDMKNMLQSNVNILEQNIDIFDLSYDLDDKTIFWPGDGGFNLCMKSQYITQSNEQDEQNRYFYSAGKFSCPEHGGTHVDSPYHFCDKGITVDQIQLKDLIAPCRLIDVSQKCKNNPDYQLSQDDIQQYEIQFGAILQNSIVIIRTGWSQYYKQGAQKYLGYDEKINGKYNGQPLQFPGISQEAAITLVVRKICAVGLDTASLDSGSCTNFIAHRILLGAGIYGIENLNSQIEKLPQDKFFTLMVMPLKITGGSGSPARVLAMIKK